MSDVATTVSMLISTWDDGVFAVTGRDVRQELAGRSVRSLTSDDDGGVLAVVDGRALCRRSATGGWTEVSAADTALACCLPVGGGVLLGTDDARILRLEADGGRRWLTGFDTVEGRDTWYAGTAIVDGRTVGPPLGIRSMAVTCDGATLLANVHVGGVPRSTDGGSTWRPTIEVDVDVHQVATHPTRPELVIAAAAVGFCISRDAGVTWTIEARGLYAPHCSAVAFGRRDVFVSATTDPFSPLGAVYRRPIDSDGPLQPIGGGLPERTAGRADTDCIATRGAAVALIDHSGRLYVSLDDGDSWTNPVDPLPTPSALLIL